jgi:hypothetical protein
VLAAKTASPLFASGDFAIITAQISRLKEKDGIVSPWSIVSFNFFQSFGSF